MPETWKTIPVNTGLLAALVTGVVSVLLMGYSVQYWVDQRAAAVVDSRVAPLERRVEMLERSERVENPPKDDIRLLVSLIHDLRNEIREGD